MFKFVKLFSCLLLIGMLAAPSCAQEKQKKKKKRGQGRQNAAAQLLGQLKKANPTEDQIAKIKEIVAAHSEKLTALRKKVAISPEQRKARADAVKKAKDAGKKGKEIREAGNAAAKLSEEQVAAQAELQKAMGEIRKAAMAVLTPEQRKALGKRAGKDGAKKKKRKKKDNA